jgi:uncharacterized membrane protein
MARANRVSGNPWQLLLVIVLIFGISFRFINLDQKIYWGDETYTSLRAAGYTVKQGTDHLYTGQILSTQDLQRYQHPANDTKAVDVIRVLAEEDNHPPLYFLLARMWSQWFGDSAAAMRALSVCFSLLTLPLMYWLCLELFQASMVGWFSVTLIAVSPIFIRYAQESRHYSLWIALILISKILLLRGIRSKTKLHWFGYALSATSGLYTHLFSSLWLAGQGLYVIITERFRPSKTLFLCGITILFVFLTFIPWLVLLILNINSFISASNWIKQPLPISVLANAWSLNFSRTFISWESHYNGILIYLAIPIVVLFVYAVLFLCQTTSKRIWLLILTPAAVTAITLVLLDLIWGGQRSRIPQYFLPCYISIQITVAYLLASKFCHPGYFLRMFWRTITVLLISASILSCAINSQSETWWGWSEFEVRTCQIINHTPQPLLISDASLTQILPLSYKLEPKVRLMLLTEPNTIPHFPDTFSDVFIYNPSENLLTKLKQAQNMPIELIYRFRENSLVISLYHVCA